MPQVVAFRSKHFPDVVADVATAVAALTFASGFEPVLGSNVIAGKERPAVDDDATVPPIVVFVIAYPGGPPALDDDDVETTARVQVLVRGAPTNLTATDLVCREIMAGLHLRTDVAATQTDADKPATYLDMRVLESTPTMLGANRNEADRCACTVEVLYAD